MLLARVGEIEDIVFQRRKAAEIDQANRDRVRAENEKKSGSRGPQGAKLTQIQSSALLNYAPVAENMVALGRRAQDLQPPPPPPRTNQEAAEKMKALLNKGTKRGNEEIRGGGG